MIITAPDPVNHDLYPSSTYTWLFPAGGITKAELWQPYFCESLDRRFANLLITNPRRADYRDSAEEARIQIIWERFCLYHAQIRTFYFAPDQLQPITLFELGKHLDDITVPLIIAAHPNYPRLLDVQVQVELERPEIKILSSLDELIEATADQLIKMGQPTKQ